MRTSQSRFATRCHQLLAHPWCAFAQVYSQVANLFEHHSDLLDEFSMFLPEAVPAAQAHAENQRRLRESRKLVGWLALAVAPGGRGGVRWGSNNRPVYGVVHATGLLFCSNAANGLNPSSAVQILRTSLLITAWAQTSWPFLKRSRGVFLPAAY